MGGAFLQKPGIVSSDSRLFLKNLIRNIDLGQVGFMINKRQIYFVFNGCFKI